MVAKDGFAVDVLSAALRYHSLGWSIIPVAAGTKKPALRSWKPFQTNRADEQQIRDWFDKRDDLGLAVVLGTVSGGLTCRRSVQFFAGTATGGAAFWNSAERKLIQPNSAIGRIP